MFKFEKFNKFKVLPFDLKPVFIIQPVSAHVPNGEAGHQIITEVRNAESYQWYYTLSLDPIDWVKMDDGATFIGTQTDTLTIEAAMYDDLKRWYILNVHSAKGIRADSNVVLVTPGPLIIEQSDSREMEWEQEEELYVAADGADNYQWYFNFGSGVDGEYIPISDGATFEGTNTSNLKIKSADWVTVGHYFCRITNNDSIHRADSRIVLMSESEDFPIIPPIIDEQPPELIDGNEFTEFTFGLTASDPSETGLTYRWQINYDGAEEAPEGWLWVDEREWAGEIQGLGTDTILINNTTRIHDGLWRCVVNNSAGSITSEECEADVIRDPNIVSILQAGAQANGNRAGWNKLDGIDGQDAYGNVFNLPEDALISHASWNDTDATSSNSFRIRCGDDGEERNGDYVDVTIQGYNNEQPIRLPWTGVDGGVPRYQITDQEFCDWATEHLKTTPFFFMWFEFGDEDFN